MFQQLIKAVIEALSHHETVSKRDDHDEAKFEYALGGGDSQEWTDMAAREPGFGDQRSVVCPGAPSTFHRGVEAVPPFVIMIPCAFVATPYPPHRQIFEHAFRMQRRQRAGHVVRAFGRYVPGNQFAASLQVHPSLPF